MSCNCKDIQNKFDVSVLCGTCFNCNNNNNNNKTLDDQMEYILETIGITDYMKKNLLKNLCRLQYGKEDSGLYDYALAFFCNAKPIFQFIQIIGNSFDKSNAQIAKNISDYVDMELVNDNNKHSFCCNAPVGKKPFTIKCSKCNSLCSMINDTNTNSWCCNVRTKAYSYLCTKCHCSCAIAEEEEEENKELTMNNNNNNNNNNNQEDIEYSDCCLSEVKNVENMCRGCGKSCRPRKTNMLSECCERLITISGYICSKCEKICGIITPSEEEFNLNTKVKHKQTNIYGIISEVTKIFVIVKYPNEKQGKYLKRLFKDLFDILPDDASAFKINTRVQSLSLSTGTIISINKPYMTIKYDHNGREQEYLIDSVKALFTILPFNKSVDNSNSGNKRKKNKSK